MLKEEDKTSLNGIINKTDKEELIIISLEQKNVAIIANATTEIRIIHKDNEKIGHKAQILNIFVKSKLFDFKSMLDNEIIIIKK